MEYAVIATGGKQYKVKTGQTLKFEKLDTQPGKQFIFDEVLLHNLDGKIAIGMPHVKNITVTGKVVDHIKGKKIRVSKFKAKARYRKVTGHRQSLSTVLIEKINHSSKESSVKKETKKAE